jgi:hypothetical protein
MRHANSSLNPRCNRGYFTLTSKLISQGKNYRWQEKLECAEERQPAMRTEHMICGCGAEYEMRAQFPPWSDKDTINCQDCGAIIKSWNLGEGNYLAILMRRHVQPTEAAHENEQH